MRRTLRTFVAIEVPGAVKARARRLIDLLRAAEAPVKWVEDVQLHLTLKFLGELTLPDIAQVQRALEQSVLAMRPFAVEFRGAGAFPTADRPRTVWLGVSEGEAELVALHGQLENRLATLGFRTEGRRFRPHLTIGRVRGGDLGVPELGSLIRQRADYDGGQCEVAEVVIFSSVLERSGPTYEVLGSAELMGE